MSEREYYEMRDDITAEGNCDRCSYGICGECHLQCDESYEDYVLELRRLGI